MTTTMEGTPRTTPRPTRAPEGPDDRSPRDRRVWALLAIPFVLLAIAVAVGFAVGGDEAEPIAAVEADTYVLDGTRVLPGQADGWFAPPQAAGPQVLGVVIDAETPLRQGYESGLPDGWYDPAGGDATSDASPTYPGDRVR